MDKEQALEKLSKVYDTGAVLFYEGDPANAVWIINGGKVQLSKRVCSEEIVIETLGAGDFFGEISLLSNSDQKLTFIETTNQFAQHPHRKLAIGTQKRFVLRRFDD